MVILSAAGWHHFAVCDPRHHLDAGWFGIMAEMINRLGGVSAGVGGGINHTGIVTKEWPKGGGMRLFRGRLLNGFWVHPWKQLATLAALAASLAVQTGTGLQASDVRIEARLVRKSFTFNHTPFPAWKVDLKYINESRNPVDLSGALILVAPLEDKSLVGGAYLTRTASRMANSERRIGARYGLDFGVEVPPTGTGRWPLIQKGMSFAERFMAYAQSPWVDAMPGGGYGPPIQPNETRTLAETVLFPFDPEIRGERKGIVVIPPIPRLVGAGTRHAPRVLVFDVTGVVPKDTEFTTARSETFRLTPWNFAVWSATKPSPNGTAW